MSKSLKAAAFEGVLWAGGFAIASKVVSFASQLTLAWLLVPADFGLVAMANSAMLLLSVVQSGGIRSVLIRRQRNIGLWSGPAFWLSVSLGLLSGGLALVIMPFMVSYYAEPRLWMLISVMSAGLVVDSLAVVPTARLQAALRFRALGAANILSPIGQALCSIILASCGFGAMSLVIPKIPVGLLVAFALWRQSATDGRWSPKFKYWRYMIGDNIYMLVAWLAFAAAAQVPLVIISRMHGAQSAGLFAFATNLTTQVIALLTSQLDSVLFAALAKLKDAPTQQWQAFVKTTRILGATVFALSGLQYVLAEPLIHLLFAERWYGAIPLLQMFSLGNAILAAAIPTGGAMQAKGRSGVGIYCAFALCSCGLAIICALSGYKLDSGLGGVAAGSVVYQITISVIAWRIVSGIYNQSPREISRALLIPLFASLSAMFVVQEAIQMIHLQSTMVVIASTALGFVILWLGLLLAFWRTQLKGITTQVLTILYERKTA